MLSLQTPHPSTHTFIDSINAPWVVQRTETPKNSEPQHTLATVDSINSLEGVEDLVKLVTLDLSGNRISAMGEILRLRGLSHLVIA